MGLLEERVAIVTGAGDRAFSAGNDLKYHAEYRAKHGTRLYVYHEVLTCPVHRICRAIGFQRFAAGIGAS